MKTEYVQTDFAEITPTIKRAWEIKSHARGKNLIPLAKGEKPPTDEPEEQERTPEETLVTGEGAERPRGFLRFGSREESDGGQG